MLPISGALSFGDINEELQVLRNTLRPLGDSNTRTLYGITSGPIRLAADGYGKSLVNYDIAIGSLYQPFDYLSWTGQGDTCWCWYDTGPQYGLGDIQATHPSYSDVNLNPFVTDLCGGDIRTQTQWSKLVKIEIYQNSGATKVATIFKQQIPAASYSSLLGQYGFIIPFPEDVGTYTDFVGATKWYFNP